MDITLNGKPYEISGSANINTVISSYGYEGKMIAVAVNGTFVPKSLYEKHIINNNDEIEIVSPMQGG